MIPTCMPPVSPLTVEALRNPLPPSVRAFQVFSETWRCRTSAPLNHLTRSSGEERPPRRQDQLVPWSRFLPGQASHKATEGRKQIIWKPATYWLILPLEGLGVEHRHQALKYDDSGIGPRQGARSLGFCCQGKGVAHS